MALNVSTIDTINDLISHDPALREKLRGAQDSQDFTSKLVAAAHAKGIAIDEAAVAYAVNIAFDRPVAGTELTDDQLGGVTGGIGTWGGKMKGLMSLTIDRRMAG